MKDLPIYFVSGLPRSGSTLLMNLLGQNPNHHVTPSNDLLDLIGVMRNKWQDFPGFKSQGVNKLKPRILSAMHGTMYGFFQPEFDAGKIVFDKSRGWIAYIELLEEILQRPVKVIVTVRDVRDIVASFEKLYRKNPLTRHEGSGKTYFNAQTVEGRTHQLLAEDAVVGMAINRFRDAIKRGVDNRLVVVTYRALTAAPVTVMHALHDSLGLPRFTYDPEHVQQITHEDDSVHRMELHTIRPKVEYNPNPSWKGIIPNELATWLDEHYRDINKLAER